jgi:hypothetical protein
MAYDGAMRKSDVLAHFGGSQSAVARALKITRASVHGWPELVPEASAYRLERITAGELRVSPAIYERARAKRAAARATTMST